MTIGGLFSTLDVSASALRAQRMRMNVVANNLANVNTTHDRAGNANPYRRKEIFFRPGAPDLTGSELLGVRVDKIEEDPSESRWVYNPDHPDAVKDPAGEHFGCVQMPNVDLPIEMIDMMEASRAYEANITAMDATKQMVLNTLEILV